ncbi:MAG: 30S ribosomal protein S17 [Candidatus Buchananbacteria bacterium RIFCSPLOWO2_01_FULL_46_12]|uniref:Small ribosomal subunit protein uS17 n=2 Tax=Candidatus Buchananiibacteriota TaxID=1817903 RepID=A0A1G1YTA7_9BACT|nr:MAG: 30S ribosomal protein S17 [Candidatus Buchananbacteria bacterium RIFCSPHIGHO2_01_FULL_44_11]OGY54840.1 MAG: 30S ribosomal protein S17 [Candidatus Buchananbacteria bacterium RIFCSPLOWO2_01_FULL_46_12]
MTTPEPKTKIKRSFTAKVVSDKGDKTIVVTVNRTKVHPKYFKRYTVTRKYKVHDERNQYKVGDSVRVIECRPISKDKRWRVIYSN